MTHRTRLVRRLVIALTASTAITVACGDDSEGGDEHGENAPQVCKDLGSLCHDLDMGSGMAHECHEVGHAGVAADCEAIHDECVALCGGATGSEGAEEHGAEEHGADEHAAEEHGADTHDHSVDTDQDDPVVLYCNCVLSNCHDAYHEKFGEDEIAAQEACLMEAEGLPVNGSPTETGNFLECRQHFCDAAATDDTVCPNALGDAVCI